MAHSAYQGVTGYNLNLRYTSFNKLFVFILANSTDSDEMLHSAAFHLGLHCLPKYLFWGFQYTKG